jgi:hypothetical protein
MSETKVRPYRTTGKIILLYIISIDTNKFYFPPYKLVQHHIPSTSETFLSHSKSN